MGIKNSHRLQIVEKGCPLSQGFLKRLLLKGFVTIISSGLANRIRWAISDKALSKNPCQSFITGQGAV
jgi:hypothetical protein